MTAGVSAINLINGLNHHKFQQLLTAAESGYVKVKYFCDVCWLSKSDALWCAHVLLNAKKLFLEMKNKMAAEFDDKEWRCNSALQVDITQHIKI
jgi:hypothetical protein